MASNIDFVEYVCEQISGAGVITYKRMFGEFGIFCNGKIIGVICDNQFFVKETNIGRSMLSPVIEEAPYPGAKSHFLIESLENGEFLSEFIHQTYEELPMQKLKRKRN